MRETDWIKYIKKKTELDRDHKRFANVYEKENSFRRLNMNHNVLGLPQTKKEVRDS
jgi:hypothetical protein